jgi:ATP phosphoribosyltransferase regulatory subunit HisZ
MDALSPSLKAAQQRRVAMQDALARLEDRLAAPSGSAEWRTEVGRALSALSTSFVDHVAEVEGDDGLLAELRHDVPRLAPGVERLERDHVEISSQMLALAAVLEAADVASIRESGLELMRALVRHRQRGSDLVYEAYATDIGGQSGS